MPESLARYETQGRTAVITLNRADKRNALSRRLIADLTTAFERAGAAEDVHSILLAAEGPVFCAGMDLAELQETLERPEQESPVWDDALRLARLYDLIYAMPKPTLAIVQGPAVAGGAGLVTVCDLAIAAEDACFGYPEVRRGLVAAMVMPHLLRHVGERMARFLLLTGELIDARKALETGLVNEVLPSAQLRDRALVLSEAFAQGGPEALRKTKEFLQRFSRQAVSVEEAARGSAEPRLTSECQHGLRAFFAKTAPPWVRP